MSKPEATGERKQKRMKVTLYCVTLAILASVPNQAQTTTNGGLGWLISQSDLALVGTVTNHKFSEDRLQLVVAADQVLKGGGPGSYTITANVHPSVVKGYQRAAQRGRLLPRPRALLFARKAGPDWELHGPSKGSYPIVDDFLFELPPQYVAPARRSSDSLEDSVVRIFAAHVAALPKGKTLYGYSQSAFIALARDTRRNPGAALQQAIGEFLSSPNQDFQALGIRSKIALNDLLAPALVESAQARLDQRASFAVVNDFRNWYRSEDTLTVRAVVQVLNTTRNESLEEACVWILHLGHIRASLPALAAVLDSPNPKIRLWAVAGLSAFANNMNYGSDHSNPGPWRYRTEETLKRSIGTNEQLAGAASVQFWRGWWERYKKELIDE